MVAIACLGWGSLIWDPDGLPVGEWHKDGPDLPLEFARLSGRGRVTLVLMPDGPRVPVLWTLLDVASLEDGEAALRKREGTKPDWIGRWPSVRDDRYAYDIGKWATAKRLDGVVWTGLPPKWGDENGRIPTKDEVLDYLSALPSEAASEPLKYLRNAPLQIQTPYRAALAKLVGA